MIDLSKTLVTALADRYEFQSVVGRGGMATVYVARDIKHNRQVAIKVLRPELAVSLGVDRFLREIEIAAQLNHPHILPLLDSGNAESELFYVMPFIDGESLRGLLNRERPLSIDRSRAIASEVADALGYAHRQGVVHRDIKPENILLSEGHAVVADFGIAKALSTAGGEALTRTGFPLGTPGYMSPEQAAGNADLDSGTDVFSLACVVYEMLVGEIPGMWPTSDEIRLGRFEELQAHHRERLDSLSGSVEQALAKAMAPRSRGRFETPSDFVRAMDQAAPGARQYGDTDVAQIIQQAADLQAQQDTASDALSLGGLQQIGAQVGIPPEQVLQAAEMSGTKAPTAHTGWFAGMSSKVHLERTLNLEIADNAYDIVLEDVRARMGEAGRLNPTLGRSLSWNSLSFQNSLEGSGRLTQVLINPKSGRTRIRITESAGMHGIILTSCVLLIGGMSGAILANATALPVAAIAVAVTGVVTVSTVATRALLQKFKARRQRILSSLLDQITGHVIDEGKRLP